MPNLVFADCGSRSSFYIINEKCGFKTFDAYEDAVYAHDVQLALSKNNLAPKVYSDVKKMIINRRKEWGFESEIAEMLGCGGNECDCGKCEDIYDSKIKTVNNLCKKIKEIGYEFVDSHVGNVGYVRRNGRRKLVCIDTGCESVTGGDDSYLDDDDGPCSCSACRGN